MSEQDRNDFSERLNELSNWQIEQKKKLRAFQEMQRKLLDREYQNIFSPLRTHNGGESLKTWNEEISNCSNDKSLVENRLNDHNFKTKEINELFQLKFPEVRLKEPSVPLVNRDICLFEKNKEDNFYSDTVENLEDRENKPKKFLKRGEGLARFRMTLDDFKKAPKIYKDKKIKTYLNGKPEPKNNKNSKLLKVNPGKGIKNVHPKTRERSAPLPVKIYVPENKPKQFSSNKNAAIKPKPQSNRTLSDFFPKKCIENVIKPYAVATEWYNIMREKEKECRYSTLEDKPNSVIASEISKKKDEKELEIFEMLEKRIDDSSFCSNSSFFDKLLEQTVSSSPVKSLTENKDINNSYNQGVKFFQSQNLNEDQDVRFEKLDKTSTNEENIPNLSEPEINIPDNFISENNEQINTSRNEICTENNVELPNEQYNILDEEEHKSELPPHKVNKTLLQEYIKDFKKFKHLLEENSHKLEDEHEELSSKEILKEDNVFQLNQQEIALKLQRKGLQDNVKHLLNWEFPSRKKQPKRVVKKAKPKPRIEKSRSASKEQEEKVIFNSSLLQQRLSELEKEIEIFRKENKNLEKLERECNEEKIKLSKERKEFEKQMQEEREKFETKITEEQKKLQKEKAVFEKYCKQVRNQPSRQEREETVNLKKELEKLTETLTTKEARWGASQARLRNQIKSIEKEKAQLKAEIEKYKKISMKKVSFESERSLSTKIIHAINSELGKLKPSVTKNTSLCGKNQSLSARAERCLEEKPIRRIKSAPIIKKPLEIDLCSEPCNDDGKAAGSVSVDSGFETNGSRCIGQRADDLVSLHSSHLLRKSSEEHQKENSFRDSLFSQSEEYSGERRSAESAIESVVREAIFGDSDTDSAILKITDIKNRLERLSLLNQPEKKSESPSVKVVNLPPQHRHSGSDEDSRSFVENENDDDDDDDDDDDKGNEIEIDEYRKKRNIRNRNDSYSNIYLNFNSHKKLLESKVDENGIWEKLFEDGSKEINYPNGNVKKIFPGSKIVRMTYYNGDIKETNVVESSEKYYYAETKTWHTTYKDGLEVLEFPNGQTERRHADGTTEISFPNGCIRYYHPSGKEEWRFSDGTVIKTNEYGHKILLMPNGQKEIHTREFKKREYPDGTVKILYSDGTQETRYSSGRVRLKDKDGNLVMDSGGIR